MEKAMNATPEKTQAEWEAELEREFRRQETKYPCVAERADGEVDYWAVTDTGDPRTDLRRGLALAGEVCSLIRANQDYFGPFILYSIVPAALEARRDPAHPGQQTAGAFLDEIFTRAIELRTSEDLERELNRDRGPLNDCWF